MTLRLRLTLLAALGLGIAIAGCQEQLTAPGNCPETCPGGSPVLRDTVLDALVDGDSVFTGYLARGGGAGGLQVSNAFLGATRHGVIRFVARQDSLFVRDTARAYTIDSVVIELSLLARDTSATGMVLALHRIPATTDTSATFATIDPLIVPGTLIDSVTILDSVDLIDDDSNKTSFTYKFVFQGDTLALVDIPPADSGVLAIATALTGGTATGIRLGGGGTGGNLFPRMKTYVTLDVPDTAVSIKKQVIDRGPSLTTFVSSAPAPAIDPAIHQIGGGDAGRLFLRFPWPAYLRDSALLARATLELTPAAPFDGLPGDTGFVNLHGIAVDLGAKSPLINPFRGTRALPVGSSDTVRIDIISEVQAWQRDRLPHPPVIIAKMDPEGASYTEPRFYSTGEVVAARRPRLRITYQLPFDFERP